MTEDEKLDALVRYRLEQADEALRSAETNHAHGLERSAVNRVYYSMFYAVLALLATRLEETSRHSGAISLFDRHYIKPGALPRELSKWLHDAFNERQGADYGAEFRPSAAAIDDALARARRFLDEVTGLLRSDGFLNE